MRFRFCGDADCPDWVLTEITTLARMTSVKMKLLTQLVAKSLGREDMDMDKARKLTSDAKFDEADLKAGLAALRWLVGSAARHGVDQDSFSSELQQLGLPREHAQAVARVLADNTTAISATLRANSLRVSRLQSATCVPADSPPRFPAAVLKSSDVPAVRLTLRVQDGVNKPQEVAEHEMTLSATQLRMLISDLRKARSVMEGL